MLLITAGLTTTSLLLVRRSVETNVRQSIAVNLRNSVAAFQDFRHERETMLTSDVALLADLPITRAIMTSPDPVTIQDASQDISANRQQRSVRSGRPQRQGGRPAYQDSGIHDARRQKNTSSNLSTRTAEKPATGGLANTTCTRRSSSPFTAAREPTARLLGFLVIGYEINDRLAA